MKVTIQFCGAARTVTGSCYLFETHSGRFLVDCGMFQGTKTLKALNYSAFPFRPSEIKAILLTHAHIDHSGLIPKLMRDGFSGTVLATRGTMDLCSYLLPDAGSIQESEVSSLNRRNLARGRPAVEPIYTQADGISALDLFRAIDYERWIDVIPGVRARYWNAGHILGSASIEIEFKGDGGGEETMRLLASGDIGPEAKLLQSSPQAPSGFDYVISESTYGNIERAATTASGRRERLAAEVRAAAVAKGPLLIPAFAVERTQELLADIIDLMERGEIPSAPVFLDSPLAIRTTEVFRQNSEALSPNVDLNALLSSPHLRFTESPDESKAIEKLTGFHIVVAASGMCDAGRIRHHLKRWLWNHSATVLLVGFQAKGTLGRFLQDSVSSVRIQGEEIKVGARIREIDDYSGHADGPEVAAWIAERNPIRKALFLVHGEEPQMTGLYNRVAGRTVEKEKIILPVLDDVYELAAAKPAALAVTQRRRLAPEAVVNLDWHNDVSKIILEINDHLRAAADDKSRAKLIRALKRALELQ